MLCVFVCKTFGDKKTQKASMGVKGLSHLYEGEKLKKSEIYENHYISLSVFNTWYSPSSFCFWISVKAYFIWTECYEQPPKCCIIPHFYFVRKVKVNLIPFCFKAFLHRTIWHDCNFVIIRLRETSFCMQ